MSLEPVVIDPDALVRVPHAEVRGEIEGEEAISGGIGGGEVEGAERGGCDGDLHLLRAVDDPEDENYEADDDAGNDEGADEDGEQAAGTVRVRRRSGVGVYGRTVIGASETGLLVVHG
ncbi:hypothetical protein HPP92_027438 [Vanilla planifolia]|uniref:Uncharacterized protein n=1 Tax=Vanilla planifolia TaxID=51239 RepID=A0A835P906_VANPL|nr:hypothetical protein HPP92_027438 [Vanilla planifolia]KAG0449226.1 hypothetical protein HPP92_027465 [Vanilla planifolia]